MKYNPNDYYLTEILTELYPTIHKEYFRWHRFIKTVRYRDFLWKNDLEKSGNWSMVPLMKWHKPVWYQRFFFPKTYDLIKKIPIYENLMFSIYQPGTEVHPHNGWGDHYVRIHLGLQCNNQCDLIVNNTVYPERNNEVIMFDDSQLHYSYNRGSSERIILLFDILKEDLKKYKKP